MMATRDDTIQDGDEAPRVARRARLRRVALLAALALGVLVDGFFALVNFYPVAPKRDRGARRYVVAALDPSQATWFQDNVLDEFNDAHDTNFVLRAVDDERLEDAMTAPDVALAVLPLDRAQLAAARSCRSTASRRARTWRGTSGRSVAT
jgi:hypothetical protein